ncbi:YhcB family protein [Pseudoalteromonas denitrificans]|uniref:Z-ring associated protein G n=1 Tax=Pseudoalteromonas denitrificans DSM 6059 TaxID=1123010 RepID=A0A1I1R8G6_9GAMM|nr:YhcB family protein [Pseudoalteromonas denitrificans]SFD30605.1 hypothetical protein SAMN02745724_04152 [Pseudoalteromonas denitrificans DSM 6059]
MSTITWLSFLLITAIASFFVGTVFTKRQYENDELEKEVEKAKSDLEQYKQDVADHLASTDKLVSKMKDNYEQLANHVQQTNKLLLVDNTKEAMPFFSKETTEQLQASLDQLEEPKAHTNITDAQPMDYAQENSGIFSGTKKEEIIKEPTV